MAGNGMQQSEETATRNGIQALELAFSGVLKSRQDVENTKNTLMSHYKGGDGGAFKDLVTAWEAQADVILTNLQSMIDTLNETLREQGRQQGSANEQINQQYSQSEAVFDTLVG
jgi:early secretory antigenic target protein ESAT-6